MQWFWLSLIGSSASIFAVLTVTEWNVAGLVVDLAVLAGGAALALQKPPTLRMVGRGLASGAGLMLAVMIGMYIWVSLYMNGVI